MAILKNERGLPRSLMLAACVLLALVCSLAVAHPASAYLAFPKTVKSDTWGQVEFEGWGDKVTVHDWAADGFGVQAEIQLAPPNTSDWFTTATCTNTNGYDGAAKVCNEDFPETYQVHFMLYKVTGSGHPFNAVGWSPITWANI